MGQAVMIIRVMSSPGGGPGRKIGKYKEQDCYFQVFDESLIQLFIIKFFIYRFSKQYITRLNRLFLSVIPEFRKLCSIRLVIYTHSCLSFDRTLKQISSKLRIEGICPEKVC